MARAQERTLDFTTACFITVCQHWLPCFMKGSRFPWSRLCGSAHEGSFTERVCMCFPCHITNTSKQVGTCSTDIDTRRPLPCIDFHPSIGYRYTCRSIASASPNSLPANGASVGSAVPFASTTVSRFAMMMTVMTCFSVEFLMLCQAAVVMTHQALLL